MIPLVINGFCSRRFVIGAQLEQITEMNNWYSTETLHNQHCNHNSQNVLTSNSYVKSNSKCMQQIITCNSYVKSNF